jgi:hypothetical protein
LSREEGHPLDDGRRPTLEAQALWITGAQDEADEHEESDGGVA